MNALSRLDFDLADIPVLADELMVRLNTIREAKPVFWSDIQKGWFITRYADVNDGFLGKLPLSNVRLSKVAFAAIPEEEWPRRIPLLTGATPMFANMTDPPQHTHLRRPVNPAFARDAVERLRPYVQEQVALLLDEAEQRREFEFIDVIARPLTGKVIMRLMGMPDETLGKLQDWANSIVNALGTPRPSVALLEEGERAMREMKTAFFSELESRKASPRPDLLTVLAAAREASDPMTDDEVLGTCVNTLLAGHESTASTMAMAVAALSEHPPQVAFLASHPECLNDAVGELSRFVALSASQTRVAAEDFEWHGERIRKGDIVYLWIASANRDPRVFDRPDELDLSRGQTDTLVFGRGIHHCLGHLLAKLELGEFYRAGFRRLSFECLDHPLRFTGGYAFRTISQLNVRVRRLS